MIKTLVCFIFIFLSSHSPVSAVVRPGLLIENPQGISFDELQLQKQFTRAYQLFASEIGPLEQDITISIGEANCLRTGYNFVHNKVFFCPNINVPHYGLNSIDVINHELFHAFLCNYKAALCGENMRADVHEGLADYFSYLLMPDEFFGEHFYHKLPYVRRYHTSWRSGLVESDHARGNVYASELIQTKQKLKAALLLFDREVQSEVIVEVSGAEVSHLNRYRLPLQQSMTIEFKFHPEAKVAKVEWRNVPGVVIRRLSPTAFEITLTSIPATPKVTAYFISREGKELGFKHFYFGLRKPLKAFPTI